MDFREFFVRQRAFFGKHKIASAAAVPAVLGIATVVAVSFALPSTNTRNADPRLTSSVTECHDMVTISVAGRNDSPNEATTKMLVDANGNALPAALSGDYSSEWLDPVVNAPNADPNSNNAAVYIAYPANLNTEADAVNTGVANTEQVMREISAACPNTKFSIVGYSEGSVVVRQVAQQVGHQTADQNGKYGIVDPNNVLGVVILADAGRSAGEGPFIGATDPNHPDGYDANFGGKTAGGQGALPDTAGDFGSLNGKIASFCSDGDDTCSAPQNISLLQLAINVGRHINVDDLQNNGLTPATGQDVAVNLAGIALAAFQDIASTPHWLQSNETFLQVLLKVSTPGYKPGTQTAAPVAASSIATNQMSDLAYLPQKVFNEIVGLIVTNTNTIPVILSDPYNQTLGPDRTGHHFDYWHDADPANGKPLTSAEYAAAWLTHLAQQAQNGQKVDTTAKPEPADLAAAYKAAQPSTTTAPTTTTDPSKTTTTTPKSSTTTVTTTPNGDPKAVASTSLAPTTAPTTTVAPTTTAPTTTTDAMVPAAVQPTTTAPTTTAPTTTTTDSAAPTTTPHAN
ncbi:cutinase family protein [Nocardia sp. NBC_01327]|uniref:cutinase family protein n=1 Tax=Nocardia sp. NBC_01327 TaxID=2903593 RepID=UPI002E1508BC|nr:cutinase family protein [Nocardia sp. NBC_01327]